MRHRLACLEHCRDVLKAVLQLSNLVSSVEKALGETRGDQTAASGAEWGQELLGNAQMTLALLDVADALAVVSNITDRVLQCQRLVNPHPIVNDLVSAAEQGNVVRYQEELARLVELTRNSLLPNDAISLTGGYGNWHRDWPMQ